MWNCVANDCIGYCKGEPDWERKPTEQEIFNHQTGQMIKVDSMVNGTCKRKPKNCELFMISEFRPIGAKEVITKKEKQNLVQGRMF